MKAYFFGQALPIFDFSDIRPKGARLITSGGKAPGPEPLKDCLYHVQKILDRKEDGDKLTTLEVHDIVCYIADAVLAGGIRRAALIALFSYDDEDMLTCKFGNWWELNPQRARANNTVVLVRHRISKEDFFSLWEKIKASKSGEPGFFFTNDAEYLLNPCAEISLRAWQFCNLTTINVSDVVSQEDLNKRAAAAAFIGTLQASYTDFHYLRSMWKKNTEKDALIGVSMTGIASNSIKNLDVEQAAKVAVLTNKIISEKIGIKSAARVTCIKPEGTGSGVVGSAPGVHAYHSKFYKRRIRVGKNEAIYPYLWAMHNELVEDEFFRPTQQAVITIPQKAPDGAILRTESAVSLLERVKKYHEKWIKPGHIKGPNTNNVSTTVSVKDNEWDEVGNWMWNNRNSYTALSLLPYDNHTYVQAPFEECTEEEYNKLMESLTAVDLTQVLESEDFTDLKGELACAGGACEVK